MNGKKVINSIAVLWLMTLGIAMIGYSVTSIFIPEAQDWVLDRVTGLIGISWGVCFILVGLDKLIEG